MSSSRRASITASRVPASSTLTRPFKTSGALLLKTASRRAKDSGKRQHFQHAGHVLQRENAPAVAFARAHAAHRDHDTGDGDLFPVSPPFHGGQIDGSQFRKLGGIFGSGWPEI